MSITMMKDKMYLLEFYLLSRLIGSFHWTDFVVEN